MTRRISTLLLVACVSCVSGSKSLSSDDKERVKAFILDAPPADIPHKIDINFENKAHLIGYKLEPEQAKAGDDVKITMYWRVEDKIDDGWMLFTHVNDDASDHIDNLDMNGPLREKRSEQGGQLLGPDRWEKGKVYVDTMNYKMTDAKGSSVTILTGIWKGGARLRIISGPNDGGNGGIVGKIKVVAGGGDQAPKGDAVPEMKVKKLAPNEKITIDGKADDAAWTSATSTGAFIDVSTGAPNTRVPVNGTAKLAWDDSNLYVLFDVKDADVVSAFDKAKNPGDFTATGLPKLWTKDTIEIMTDPEGDGDNKDYYELQINPANLVFHSKFDTRQQPNGGPNGPFGHEDWDPKLKSAVVVHGTLDKDDKDEGYTVEAAIPWTAFVKAAPALGTTWRMNFYAMQKNDGVSWSPILGQGSFHFAPRFGRVTWAGSDGQVPPPPAPPAASGAASAANDMPPNEHMRNLNGVGIDVRRPGRAPLRFVAPPAASAK